MPRHLPSPPPERPNEPDPTSPYPNTMLAFTITLIIIVFIAAIIFSISLYHILIELIYSLCHHTPSADDDDIISNPSDSSLSQKPMTPDELISSLPLLTFGSETCQITDGECSVCLSSFKPNDQLRLLPLCCHAFHSRCVDTWLTSNRTCPICRSTIDPTEDSILEREATGNEIGGGSQPQGGNRFGDGLVSSSEYIPVTPSAPYFEGSPMAEYSSEPTGQSFADDAAGRGTSYLDCSLPSPTNSLRSEDVIPAAAVDENEDENRIWEYVREWCNWLSQ